MEAEPGRIRASVPRGSVEKAECQSNDTVL
jgi:hypothetical protein